MRITDIRETAIPLKSDLKNSSIDFSEMTTSVVAVITNVIRDGKPVAGFAFNSTGRYACGAQMRARFIPRIMKAEPKSLLNEAGDNFDPEKILAVMMRNEKSGGHSERSVGIGTIEVAVWDAIAKIEGKPLHRVLAMENHERLSLAYFFNPAYPAVIRPLASAVGPDDAAHYRDLPWAEFRRRRADGDYADYGAEVQISDWRV